MTGVAPYPKRIVSFAVRTAFALAVLWLLFSLIDPRAVATTLKTASPTGIFLALCLVPVHLAFRVWRWNILLRASGEWEGLGRTARIVLAGYPFSATTPGELGDVFVRTRFHTATAPGKIAALVLLDKGMQGIVILLGGAPAIAMVVGGSSALGFAVFTVLLLLVLLAAFKRKRILGSAIVRSTAHRAGAPEGLQNLIDLPRKAVVAAFLLTVGTLLVFSVQEYFLLNAVGDAPFGTVWLGYWSVISAQMVLPFFIAGLGIRESAHVYFFGLLGVGATQAMSTSLLLFGVNILLPSLIGLVFFFLLPGRTPPGDRTPLA